MRSRDHEPRGCGGPDSQRFRAIVTRRRRTRARRVRSFHRRSWRFTPACESSHNEVSMRTGASALAQYWLRSPKCHLVLDIGLDSSAPRLSR